MTDDPTPNNDLITDPLSLTTDGLPYPESTGPLNQGANDIKALALALQGRGHGLRVFAAEIAASPLNAAGDYTYTFPVAFKSGTKPVCVVGLADGSNANAIFVSVMRDYTSHTAVSIRCRDKTGAALSGGYYLNIIAIGQSAT